MSKDYERLLTKVGTLYYIDDIPQNVIAEQLGLSKSKVCRLIADAKKSGIVQISISQHFYQHSEIEHKLEKLFGLREAVVVSGEGDLMAEIGRAAASCLNRILKPGDIIGISWGSTLLSVVNQLMPVRVSGLRVVQLVGGISPQTNNHVQPSELAMRLALVCGCNADLLYSPAKASNMSVKEGLLSDVSINRVINLGKKANVALVGIGALSQQAELFRSGFVSTELLSSLRESGAVGDVCMRFYDIKGQETTNELSRLTMSITMEDLRNIKNVICVATGREKTEAILGALRGGIAKTLITDKMTAERVIELYEKTQGI